MAMKATWPKLTMPVYPNWRLSPSTNTAYTAAVVTTLMMYIK